MKFESSAVQYDVCIIGSGIVGLLIALGLSRIGFTCIVLEQQYPGSGASLNCGGVLHSGARYAIIDSHLAKQCFSASQKLLEDYPFAISASKGAYYVGFSSEHYNYSRQLLDVCASYDCFIHHVDPEKILTEEPSLNPNIKFGLEVPEYVIDPTRLIVPCLQHLKDLGTSVMCGVNIISLEHESTDWRLQVCAEAQVVQIKATGLIIAAGAWTTHLLKTFLDIQLSTHYINGSMVVLSKRLTNRIVSLCDRPSTGDTVIPCYEQSLLGSTWRSQGSFAPTQINQQDFDEVVQKASTLIRYQAMNYCSHSYSSVRSVLVDSRGCSNAMSRRTHRDFYILGGKTLCKFPNFVTAFGGKLTLCQSMASAAISTLLEQMEIKLSYLIDFSLSPSSRQISTNLGSQDKSQVMAVIS